MPLYQGFQPLEGGFREREPQPGTDAGTGMRTEEGTVSGTTTGTTRITKSGTGWGMGVAGGGKCGMENEVEPRLEMR